MNSTLLKVEAQDLIREHSDGLVEFQLVPDLHRRGKWLLVGLCSDGDCINLGGGLSVEIAKASLVDAECFLLGCRTSVKVPGYLIPTMQSSYAQHNPLPAAELPPIQENPKPTTKPRPIGTVDINKRMLLWELGNKALDEIAKKKLVPPGFWKAGGARRRVPRHIQWQRVGNDDHGVRYKASLTHRTFDCKTSLCGQLIPPSTSSELVWDASGRRQCKVCLSQLTKWGYPANV